MYLDGPTGSLALTLFGYQFPRPGTDPHDANWLVVRADVRHPRGSWSAADPCLLTSDVAALADWLDAVAAGRPAATELDFLEPCLRFEVCGAGAAGRALRVHFDHELRPPWARADTDEPVYLDLAAAPDALAAAAAALRAQLARYPQRAVAS